MIDDIESAPQSVEPVDFARYESMAKWHDDKYSNGSYIARHNRRERRLFWKYIIAAALLVGGLVLVVWKGVGK